MVVVVKPVIGADLVESRNETAMWNNKADDPWESTPTPDAEAKVVGCESRGQNDFIYQFIYKNFVGQNLSR